MNCNGIFGRLLGHNYKPVFNQHPPTSITFEQASRGAIENVIASMTRTEYVHHCCTRCGNVIQRQS